MVWRLVRSLETLRTQVRAAAPRAVPPATPVVSWGTVGDLAHASGTSDHNPKVYPALGTTAVVCAADFPHAPALGLDGGVFTEALRLSRDPRIGYVIFNGRIFSGHVAAGVPAFTWRAYDGSDKHRDHWHVSSVHTAAADSTSPWRMPGVASVSSGGPVELTTTFLPNSVKSGNVNEALTRTWQNTEKIADGQTPAQTTVVGKLDQLLARPVGGGTVTLSPEQYADLKAALRADQDAYFMTKSGQVAQAAAEAAVRSVLGSLDGAVPPPPQTP